MSTLTVELGKEGGAAYGAPVPAEIFDADLQVVERTMLRVGTPNLIKLKPGRYLVRVQLPSGRRVQSAAKLTAKRNAHVDLGPLDSPAEAPVRAWSAMFLRSWCVSVINSLYYLYPSWRGHRASRASAQGRISAGFRSPVRLTT